jgi:hypothetical protein
MATLNELRSNDATSGTKVARVDMKFEVVVIPVSDVDRAKDFYGRLGWRLDADFVHGDDWRGIQFTPPGAPSSRANEAWCHKVPLSSVLASTRDRWL